MDEPHLKMQKVEQNGKILYLVWPPDGRPPILLNCQMKAQEFLEKENLLSVVPLSRFDFKKPTSENSSPQTPMIVEENRKLPSQVTLDNCNTQKIDCIVAYS